MFAVACDAVRFRAHAFFDISQKKRGKNIHPMYKKSDANVEIQKRTDGKHSNSVGVLFRLFPQLFMRTVYI
jgi:hypothetical protein